MTYLSGHLSAGFMQPGPVALSQGSLVKYPLAIGIWLLAPDGVQSQTAGYSARVTFVSIFAR